VTQDLNRAKALIDRFEKDSSIAGLVAEDLIIEILNLCGLPATRIVPPGRPDNGVDCAFTTDKRHGGERFAVQVKTIARPANTEEVRRIVDHAARADYPRWLFVSRTGFTTAVRANLPALDAVKIELLSPEELRRWVEKITWFETPRGSRVRAVVRESMRVLAAIIAQDHNELYELEWRQLEMVLREAFERLGYETVLTPGSKDGGFDLRLTFHEKGEKKVFLVEVKHWTAPSRPGSDVVCDFAKVVAREEATGGVILSTSGFTKNVAEGLTEIERRKLRLGKDDKIIALCKTYYKIESEIWIADQDLTTTLYEGTIEPGTIHQT
jgi:restriction system protein